MFGPDLMLTKAAALGRQEQQRRMSDPYAESLPAHVYRRRQIPSWLRRVQFSVARRLVAWGERLQAYNTLPASLARRRPVKADRLETI